MVELGVALAWIAISAAGLQWLTACARVAASGCAEEELASYAGHGVLAHEDLYPIDPPPRPRGARR
jgi:hypothetical protein